MSKFIERISLASIERIAIVLGDGRSMAQVKGSADYILNTGFYDMANGRPVGHLKADGTVYSQEPWSTWGFAWDKGNDLAMLSLPAETSSYLSGVELLTPWDGAGKPLCYRAEVGGSRPRTAMATDGSNLILYCTDNPTTPETVREELIAAGAKQALMLDSGGSTQCDFQGRKISSSRRVHNYLAVWLKKTGETPEKEETHIGKKVVLDPGHGVETPGKCAPDQSYYEHEFNLDIARRVRAILQRHGVQVVLTRQDDHEPVPDASAAQMERLSLAARVKRSNDEQPDLFVSFHSNASGDGKTWTDPDGYGIYTSAEGDGAARNKAARAILARVKEAGIPLWGGGLFHELFYVLRHTHAPAVLIEHGFHTNRAEVERLKDGAYRQRLAVADAKGILDYLGIAWIDEPAKESACAGVCPCCGTALKIVKG